VQFPLEVTPAMVADWLGQEVNRTDAVEFAAAADPVRGFGRLRELSEIVFGRWGRAATAAGSAR
jgi:hypothetical protein